MVNGVWSKNSILHMEATIQFRKLLLKYDDGLNWAFLLLFPVSLFFLE